MSEAATRPEGEGAAPAAGPRSGEKKGAPAPGRFRVGPLDFLIVALVCGLAATWVVPWLQNSRRAANEAAALTFLREIQRLEAAYRARPAAGREPRYATSFFELAAAGVLGGPAPEGPFIVKDGYVFKLGTPGDPTARYFAIATPEKFGETGTRSFYTDETGTIRQSPGPAVGPAFPEVP